MIERWNVIDVIINCIRDLKEFHMHLPVYIKFQ